MRRSAGTDERSEAKLSGGNCPDNDGARKSGLRSRDRWLQNLSLPTTSPAAKKVSYIVCWRLRQLKTQAARWPQMFQSHEELQQPKEQMPWRSKDFMLCGAAFERIFVGLTPELTRRRPELFADNKPGPGGRVE